VEEKLKFPTHVSSSKLNSWPHTAVGLNKLTALRTVIVPVAYTDNNIENYYTAS